MTPIDLYHSLIADVCLRGAPERRTPVTLEIDDVGEPLRLASVGFYPNRWVKYCDDYLGSGPSYDRWLDRPRECSYEFSNAAHHARGSCVTSISLHSSTVRLRSRACLLVPVGLLDLRLIQLTMRRLGVRRAQWIVDDLQIDPVTLGSYDRYDELPRVSDVARRGDAFVARVSDAQLDKRVPGVLGRHKKAIRRIRQRIESDERHVADAFTYATPREFHWLDRDVSESWVRRATGPRGYGEWQYPSLDGLERVVERLGRAPQIADLAEMRAARLR